MVQENNLNKILIICGATASGKTKLSIECAKLLNTEIISADSMNIYKGLDVGTAKPTKLEREGIAHHLIDVASPTENFTVSDFKKRAEIVIKELHQNGKIPIICGGTGFYINSLLYDFSYGNGVGNIEVRDKYKKLAEEKGNEYVFNILKEVDIESANKLHPNDLKRVIRALEIFENGTKKSDIKDDLTPKYDYSAYTLNFNREVLYERIDKRVDMMIELGLVEEIKSILKSGVTLEHQSMQGIGYKEIIPYLNGEYSLQEAIDKIKLNTRHYAKRQITFFKKLPGLNNIDVDKNSNFTEIATRICDKL